MTTNANDIHPNASLLVDAGRAMHIADADIYDVLDASIDLADDFAAISDTYADDVERTALHVLATHLYSSDDDFDDLRLAVRVALDIADDDDRRMIAALND